MMSPASRYRGCLLGLAIGDALGAPIEFRPPGTFEPVTGMKGGGPFNLSPGQWTDDTSLALCLAESLIEKQGFDPLDQLKRYCCYFKEGYMSCTGRCEDIGNTTKRALMRFMKSGEPYPGITAEWSASNGSLMRLAPVPMFYASDPAEAIEKSGLSSKTTHALPIVVDACRYYGGLIVGALTGASRGDLLSPRYAPISNYWQEYALHEEIDAVAAGSFLRKEPPEIQGRGHVGKAMEAALWAFRSSHSFEEGCLLAVNLGDDADTTGAIYGQLAGAFYGDEGIPKEWLDVLAKRELIEGFTERLMEGG